MKHHLCIMLLIVSLSCQRQKAGHDNPSKVATKSTSFSSSTPFGRFRIRPLIFEINPLHDTLLVIGNKGTQLHIPAYAFQNEEKDTVTTPVQIEFKEYRNAAEMAYSGIPMVYNNGSEEFNFNSSGMFEIYGSTKGKTISLRNEKSLTIDYALARKNPDIAYYQLKGDRTGWTKIQTILTIDKRKKAGHHSSKKSNPLVFTLSLLQTNSIEPSWKEKNSMQTIVTDKFARAYSPSKEMIKFLEEHPQYYLGFYFSIDTISGKIVNITPHPKNPTRDFDMSIVSFMEKLPPFDDIPDPNTVSIGRKFAAKMPTDNFRYELIIESSQQNKQSIESGNVQLQANIGQPDLPNTLRPQVIDAGHIYPDIIKGLKIPSFGVYNCDQIYRIQNKINIQANYTDEEGKPLTDLHVLSLIELDYNGAFSFDPYNFTCSATGRHALVLFTKDDKIYMLDPQMFKMLNIVQSGEYTFKVKDVSNIIKSTTDLASYLELGM